MPVAIETKGLTKDYRSPLKFDDGTAVKNAADWQKRRGEILKYWHNAMGEWPALIEKPTVEYLSLERREGIMQNGIKIETAPGRMAVTERRWPGRLLKHWPRPLEAPAPDLRAHQVPDLPGRAALEHEHLAAGLGESRRIHAASRTGADDQHLDLGRQHAHHGVDGGMCAM